MKTTRKGAALRRIITVAILTTAMLAATFTSFAAQLGTIGTVEGFIKNISREPLTSTSADTASDEVSYYYIITVEDYDSDKHTLITDTKTRMTIDLEPVYDMSEFKNGMEVYIEYRGDRITYIDGYSTDAFAKIDPGSRTRTGTVAKADRDRLEVTDVRGAKAAYTLTPATIITRSGLSVSQEQISEGDRVKLYFDEYNTSIASRVEIEGRSVLLKGVYRGVIANADRYDDTLSFSRLEVMKNGAWEKVPSSGMKLSADGKTYIGGSEVARQNLQYYRGKTAYMAVGSFFGSDSIEKMVIKDKFERLYSEKLDGASPYSSQYELSNKRNISVTDGSIVVKNGRLVTQSALTSGQSTLIVADANYSGESASVVMVRGEGAAPSGQSGSYIYSATLAQVLEYTMKTSKLFVLENHEWASMDDSEFSYDEDTYIYDADNGKIIDTKQFQSGDYAPGDSEKSKHAYIYASGDRIGMIAISSKLDSLGALRTTAATSDSAYQDSKTGWMLTARDASDYSAKKEKWMPRNTSVSVILEGALIIKNGKPAKPQDILPGDSLYIVRDDAFAKVVFVKD